MYNLPGQEELLFYMLYAGAAVLSLIASCYLLFRQGNAFARDITPPVRLRRWTAAFFAAMTLSHVWYMPIIFLSSSNDIMLTYLVGALLDCMTIFPLAIIVLLCMLQDRRRPLWPVWVIVAPLVVGMAFCISSRNNTLIPMLRIYILLMGIGLITYMVRALRQYGRRLRDNYADLEHKEVWQSFVVLAFMLLLFVFYTFIGDVPLFHYAYQVFYIVLLGYLLWRVETLSDLSIPVNDTAEEMPTTETVEDDDLSLSMCNRPAFLRPVGSKPAKLERPPGMSKNIGLLLQQHCIDTQLYLQHDMTLAQLAKSIGTNRYYLSQYFSSLDMNYNTYINNLRINHFVGLYREALDTQRSFTVQQLALESGYRSYTTFSDAFKRKMGLSVRSWMKAARPEGKAQYEKLGEP